MKLSAGHTQGTKPRFGRAFTLVEVLVALSILSMLSLLSFRGISALISTESRMSENASRLRAVERIFAEFENEVQFASPRPAWNSSGSLEPAISARGNPNAGYRVSFSHVSSAPDTPPYRVTYRFSPPDIELSVHDQLDAASGSGSVPIKVLEGLNGASLRFLAADQRWSDQWPPSGLPATSLPRAVELTLDIEGLGSVTRLVARP